MKEKLPKKDVVEKKEVIDDEPSIYHYLVILGIVLLIFGIFYLGAELFYKSDDENIDFNDSSVRHLYKYEVGNITFNLYFDLPTQDLDNLDYEIELNKLDILNTKNFTVSFKEYEGEDNGAVTVSSVKFINFLKAVYLFKFDKNSFVPYNETNCSSSTKRNKIIVFDPNTTENSINFNGTNGCIEFNSKSGDELLYLTDKFVYELTKQ